MNNDMLPHLRDAVAISNDGGTITIFGIRYSAEFFRTLATRVQRGHLFMITPDESGDVTMRDMTMERLTNDNTLRLQ